MKFNLAVLQTTVHESKKANLEQLEIALESMTFDADMITLPEMFTCPYKTDLFPEYAEIDGGETQTFISKLAEKHNIYISAGSIPEVDENGKIYNTAYVFDRKGNQIAKHRKAHLFDISIKGGQHFQESETLTPGNNITVFETEFCKMGLLICYDMRFPEIAGIMAKKDAKVILAPAAFNMTTGPLHWEFLFRQRAVDNQLYTVGTSPARQENSVYVSWAHSIIADPWGRIVKQLEEKPGIIISEIDLDIVKEVRDQLPLTKHKRYDMYSLEEIS